MALRGRGRTWSRVALVMGSAVRLAHTRLWASSRGRRLRAARAQDSAMAGWRGTWTQAELVAGGYSDLYIEPWAEPWSPLMTQSDERLRNALHKSFPPSPKAGSS